MRSKKLLTLLLVICMVISCIAPAASAVSPAGSVAVSTADAAQKSQLLRRSEDAAETDDANVVTGSEAICDITADAPETAPTEPTASAVSETGDNGDGQWSFTEIDEADVPETVSGLLTENSTTDNVAELEALEDVYDASQVVTVFVVLEDEPLAATYGSAAQVPENVAEAYAQKQQSVYDSIVENVDNAAEVVRQFSFLTNSLVLSTEFKNLKTIAQMDGVASVFVSPTFYPATTTDADKMTVSSGQMTNVDDVWNLNNSGYTGAGMVIAILDTGLDVDHPSFADVPEMTDDSWTRESLANTDLTKLNAYERNKSITADYLYYSAKVPFTFNYALGTNNVTHNDSIGDHGTHVAGISAANEVEGTGVVGMAPDAQLVIMKVFNSTTGGASLYDFVDALEDCITLGVDVANLSLGSAAGFSETGTEEVDEIFERIESCGLIVNIAAGNEGTSASGSLYGSSKALTSSIDNATVASPSTYTNVMSIASVDNAYVMSDYFSVGENKVFYQPSVEVLYGYTDITLAETLSGQTLEYVMLDGLGEEDDFYDADGNSLVDGKVAVISRGSLTFSAKVANAEAAGAVAALIWNNVSEDIYTFGMSTANEDDGSYPGIPAVLIRLEDGQMMEKAEDKTMTITGDAALRINSTGGQVSSFSSWGVSADLRLLPDLAGIGGNVYSCYDGGVYGLMSGTSMATPQVTGVTALVQQYLKSNGTYDREIVENLMMSTANVITDSESKVETSPRQQGAGLVDALKAVTAEAYITVNGGRPKAELGDNATGNYSFTFTVHNMSSEAKTYTLSSSLLCEDFVTDGSYEYMAGYDRALSGSVTFSESSITVPANDTKDVTVSIDLSDDDKTWIQAHFANGNYVEGYVYLTNTAESGVSLNLPFLGFYGSWTDAPVFDQGFWYSESFWSASVEGIKDTKDAEEYYHVLWTSMGTSTNDWILGLNPYSGVLADKDGKVFYSSDNNVLTPNGDGVLDQISDYYLSLLRNARYVTLTYTDEAGNELSKQTLEYLNKTMYNSNYGSTVPYVYSWYETAALYDFKDADGNYLPDGTKVTLTISASLDYHNGQNVTDDEIVIPITIDLQKPQMKAVQETIDKDGNRYLIVTFNEAHPATVALMNPTGTQIYDQVYDNTLTKNEDGTYTAMLDITGHGDDFMVVLGDYGYQETHYQVSRTTPGGNDPVLENGLYAYQVYDLGIYYYYGWDYMFGWTEINPATGAVEMINSDAYEYYALNAAEYVDGYVFAVDAGDNFLYMKPGLWNRTTIRNIGYNVVDMAFDDATDTMYLAISDEDENFYGLATLDLLTGEVTKLKNYYSKYSAPWAMTFVDGELYCCKYYYSGFYQIDFGNSYEVKPVYTADGEQFLPTTAAGQTTNPYYGQSMTAKDGKIYWLYCSSSSTTELICIDPATWTNTAIALGSTEYVGALTLDETDYQIPDAAKITGLVLSQEDALIAEGETLTLTASCLPWNAPAQAITWSSDNESVVTVEDGVITGVTPGTATITATCGEDITASCTVRVIGLGSDLNAYDYSGDGTYGYWQTIELSTMTATNGDYSEVEFLAADYNGHDGYIYGVDSNEGYAWKVDPTSHKAEKLGYAGFIADMAYDYSTGIMYVITGQDDYLYAMNMHSGKLVKVANVYDTLGVLACDLDGNLFGIASLSGALLMLNVREGTGEDGGDEGGDSGIMPLGGWSALYAALDQQDLDDDIGVDPDPGFGIGGEDEGGASMAADTFWLGNVDVSTYDGLYYGQCMCYDYNEDVLLWCYTDGETFRQIGLTTDEDSGMPAIDYVYDLGSPSGHSLPQYFGMYVDYEGEFPELDEVYVSSITADDIFLLVGGSATVDMEVSPVNVNQPYYTYCQVGFGQNEDGKYDLDILKIDDDGTITALKPGTAWVDVYAIDEKNETCYGETTIQVTVKNATESDIRTYFGDSYCWVNINQHDVANPEFGSYVMYDSSYYFMYSAEYSNETGLIYGYGFDVNAWDANFLFFTFEPQSMSIQSAIDMGNEFPFVYDLAYDYTTGTMYALGGTTDVVSLYYVDLETGKLTPACTLDGTMYLSMTVDAEGTVYLMSKTASSYVEDDLVQLPAILSTVDVKTGEITEVLNTGVYSSYLNSLSYDYDTGYFYWTPYTGMYLIDLNDMSVNDMGTTAGQYTGLMLLSNKDTYPEVPTELVGVVMTSSTVEVDEEETAKLGFFTQPSTVDVTTAWESDDESIATVDENGVVTGVSAGTTTVTLTVTDENGSTASASCTIIVYGAGDYFLSYNVTDHGFSSINRMDPARVTNLTEGEEEATVNAMVAVDNVIYAYDEEGNFFSTTVESGFKRNYLGSHGIDVSNISFDDTEDPGGGTMKYNHYNAEFVVEDMTIYDGKVLALGVIAFNVTSEIYNDSEFSYSYDWYSELTGGCRLYEVNLDDGSLTELCTLLAEDGGCMSHAKMLEEANGSLYVYYAFNDHINVVNPEDGSSYLVASMQSLSILGEEDCIMSMSYNKATNSMIMLFTSNGNYYRLFKMNLDTASVNEIGSVGEVSSYAGDLFHGLAVVSLEISGGEHEHNWVEVDYKAPTCVENGYKRYECACGETYEKVLPATGKHEYAYNTKGELVCVHCGKIQSTTLPTIPTTPNTSGTSASLPFTDVTKNDWFYSAVSYVYNKGLMNGTSNTLFDPNGSVTRAMVVQTLYRLAGSPRVSGTNSFTDLTQDWYQSAVQWAYENGITTGRSDTIFDPNASVTREELAAFMYRYAVYCGYSVKASANLGSYTDLSALSAWAETSMGWANAEGIVNGRTATTLAPQGTATRAELATILMRFCENIVG